MKCHDEKAFETNNDEVDNFANFNDETIEAIEEKEYAKISNRKRFSFSKELREVFGI